MDSSREIFVNNRFRNESGAASQGESLATVQRETRDRLLEVIRRLEEAVRPQHPRVRAIRSEELRKPTPRKG